MQTKKMSALIFACAIYANLFTLSAQLDGYPYDSYNLRYSDSYNTPYAPFPKRWST